MQETTSAGTNGYVRPGYGPRTASLSAYHPSHFDAVALGVLPDGDDLAQVAFAQFSRCGRLLKVDGVNVGHWRHRTRLGSIPGEVGRHTRRARAILARRCRSVPPPDCERKVRPCAPRCTPCPSRLCSACIAFAPGGLDGPGARAMDSRGATDRGGTIG